MIMTAINQTLTGSGHDPLQELSRTILKTLLDYYLLQNADHMSWMRLSTYSRRHTCLQYASTFDGRYSSCVV
jgi:hypothetical protein